METDGSDGKEESDQHASYAVGPSLWTVDGAYREATPSTAAQTRGMDGEDQSINPYTV